jgi:4-hydroxyproline epimerase
MTKSKNLLPQRIDVIDSHTGGEPTRCVVAGGPELGEGPLAARLERFRREHDGYRRAILCEPRGSDVLVGALLVEPVDAGAAAGVIFFNNEGYLGMCGHGMIGVATTLVYQGKIGVGTHRFETPVGEVTATVLASGEVTVANVASYRSRSGVEVEVEGYGIVRGDVAWGGNWFFLTEDAPCSLVLANVEELTAFAWRVRQALTVQGVVGRDGAEIDHIELCGAAHDAGNSGRNFVLCPGKAYDRSPCGTGTSAKMACLAADGKLAPGEMWRQEGILGSVFVGSIAYDGERVMPSITGRAYVTAETSLVFLGDDPFRDGIAADEGSAG